MTSNNTHKVAASWSLVISNIFLFLILPCLVVWVLGNAVIRQNTNLLKSDSIDLLKKDAERICTFLDPVNFLDGQFRRFNAAIDWNTINSDKVAGLYQSFTGEALRFIPYVFKNGVLVTPESVLDDSGETIRKLWWYLHCQPVRPYLEDKKDSKAWFGNGLALIEVRRSGGQLVEFTGRKGKGLLFYAKTGPEESLDGVLLVAWTIPDVEILANFLPASYTSNISLRIEPRGHNSKRDGDKSIKNGEQQSEVLRLRKTIGNSFVYFQKGFSEKSLGSARTMLHLIIVLMVVIIATLMKVVLLQERINSLSIKYKLVALILYAVFLPLSGLTFFGWRYVAERRELLQQEAFIACQNSINELENGFEREKFKILNFYRSFQDLPDMATNTAALQPYFKEMDAKQLIYIIEIRDIHANVLVSTQNPEAVSKIGIIGKVFARYGIDHFLSHKLPQKQTLMPSAQEMLLQEFLESPFGGWARIFESPDELNPVSFGGLDLLFYWNVFPQSDYKPAVMLCDQHIQANVIKYLREKLVHRSVYKQGAMRRLACTTADTILIGSDENNPTGELRDFIGQVRRNNSPQTGVLEWQHEKWLAAGAPGKKLVGNIVLSLYPLSQIDDQTTLIKRDLAWGGILALVLALLVGRLFSSTIILPLAEIMKGVKALRRRDTSQRIQILQNDELGRLSANFNHTIETLEDVIFAKTIQAQIIPDVAPPIEGYLADLYYLPAADLGGDYCDIQPVKENEWLLVIGAVNGHGVSSALVTAMAKAIVIQCLAAKKFIITDLFVCMNKMLYSQFKRRKCMTLFAMSLNRLSGMARFANAGHPLPLHFSAGKRLPFPELFHAPLGFNLSDQEFSTAEIVMQSGDCLVFYTDVFVEMHDRSGKPLGTDGFAALCQEFIHLPPMQMRTGILAKISEISAEELDDDLTLMILKKTI
ncbi:MAG: SpoIIE family protein phosphatase [Candidatus Riflebacteria bacterium]|nr:SpoIIE family protein phosphatase [Candidatus Riflebacteria bacterium]